MASTHPKINLSVKYKEELGARKRTSTTVKSIFQRSIHVECTVQGLKTEEHTK